MLVERQKNYIEEEISERDTVNKTANKEIDKFKTFKDVKKEERIERDKNRRASLIKSIALVFIVGLTIMARYSIIYSNQKQMSNVKNEISKVKFNSDELKVQLLKFGNIKGIDEESKTKLSMVEPKIADTYFYDLSKNNFLDEKEQKSQKESIIDKIIEYLF